MIFFRILEPFRRHANVSDIVNLIVYVYVAQDTGGDYSKVLQKLLNPELKIAWALNIATMSFPRVCLSRCWISNQSELFRLRPMFVEPRDCQNIAIGLF